MSCNYACAKFLPTLVREFYFAQEVLLVPVYEISKVFRVDPLRGERCICILEETGTVDLALNIETGRKNV